MTIGERLKKLRREIGLSQEALGAQGFVSTPGWIKIENRQRSPSDKLLHRFISWLVRDEYIDTGAAAELLEELLTLKYLASRSRFVRGMAEERAKKLSIYGTAIHVSEEPSSYVVKRRPERTRTKKG